MGYFRGLDVQYETTVGGKLTVASVGSVAVEIVLLSRKWKSLEVRS